MRKHLYVLEYFYWNSFLENVIILAYYFVYCLLCKFFDRKIVCRMGEIFMMSKEQFLVIENIYSFLESFSGSVSIIAGKDFFSFLLKG